MFFGSLLIDCATSVVGKRIISSPNCNAGAKIKAADFCYGDGDGDFDFDDITTFVSETADKIGTVAEGAANFIGNAVESIDMESVCETIGDVLGNLFG